MVFQSLLKVDSSIRNGQFVYANREANKLFAELERGEYDIDQDQVESLLSSIKRTILFLRPMVDVHAQNQSSIDMTRKMLACKTKTQQNVGQ